jgi:hypothetical protein
MVLTRFRLPLLGVSVGAQSQSLVLAWDNDEQGVPKAHRPHARAQAPVDQHYVRLREELNRTFETIGLAPA